MKRKTAIVYKSKIPECYGNLKLFCLEKGLMYNTISKKSLPFTYEGFEVHRVSFISGAFNDLLG